MEREIYCLKLKKNAEGLNRVPYPGDLGKKIYDNISKEAWGEWLQRQTILINENNLVMTDTAAQKFLADEMEKFFFSE